MFLNEKLYTYYKKLHFTIFFIITLFTINVKFQNCKHSQLILGDDSFKTAVQGERIKGGGVGK